MQSIRDNAQTRVLEEIRKIHGRMSGRTESKNKNEIVFVCGPRGVSCILEQTFCSFLAGCLTGWAWLGWLGWLARLGWLAGCLVGCDGWLAWAAVSHARCSVGGLFAYPILQEMPGPADIKNTQTDFTENQKSARNEKCKICPPALFVFSYCGFLRFVDHFICHQVWATCQGVFGFSDLRYMAGSKCVMSCSGLIGSNPCHCPRPLLRRAHFYSVHLVKKWMCLRASLFSGTRTGLHKVQVISDNVVTMAQR